MKELASRRKDIIVGLIILVAVAGIFYFFKNRTTSLKVEDTEPTITQIERSLEDKFNFIVPDDVEKTELKDVSGGSSQGIATRTEVLADLPDPDAGYFYQAWLENGEKLVSLGRMSMAKGGWLTSYNGDNYKDYNKVVVSLERYFDSKLEKRVLEGNF